MLELRAQIPDLDTVVVAVGGGGLFAGVATAARHFGIRTVAVEPETCRALDAALAAGRPVDVPVASSRDRAGDTYAVGLLSVAPTTSREIREVLRRKRRTSGLEPDYWSASA